MGQTGIQELASPVGKVSVSLHPLLNSPLCRPLPHLSRSLLLGPPMPRTSR